MDVPMDIFLEVLQAGEQGAVGVARFWRRLKTVCQLAKLAQRGPGFLVLVHQVVDGSLRRIAFGFASAQGCQRWKQDLFLLADMVHQCAGHVLEDVKDFDQRRRMTAVDVSHPLGHRVEARQFGADLGVVLFHDVFTKLMRSEFGRI